jgi:hypothetical protein
MLDCHAECGDRQVVFQRAIQRPTDHPPRKYVQHGRQEYQLHFQSNVGEVRHPQLIQPCQRHLANARVSGIGVGGEGRRRHPQKGGSRTNKVQLRKSPRMIRSGAIPSSMPSPNGGIRAGLLFAQQHHGIERKSALGGNPGGQQTQ